MNKFLTKEQPQWCPGCGNYLLRNAMIQAFTELNLDPKDVVIVTGIGCSGKANHYINTYGYESIHGRAVAVATGIKLANNKLTVIAEGGDGDGYSEGGNHFLHAFRRNVDITYIVHNNEIYGLTTGQVSPTSPYGAKTKTTPFGNLEYPINPLAVAIAAKASFVARVFVGDLAFTKEIIKEAIKHKGFAFVDVLQPCVSFNKKIGYEYWQKRVYKVNHDPKDWNTAMEKALEMEKTNYEKIPVGIIYKEERPSYDSQIPQIEKETLFEKNVNIKAIEEAMKEFF